MKKTAVPLALMSLICAGCPQDAVLPNLTPYPSDDGMAGTNGPTRTTGTTSSATGAASATAGTAGVTTGATDTTTGATGTTTAATGATGGPSIPSNEGGMSVAADGGTPDADSGVVVGATDPACDLNGYWAARQSTVSNAPLIGAQFASNWYFLRLSQQGDTVTVEQHLDCGIFVRSESALGVTVELARATMETMLEKNPQRGRSGRMVRNGDRCDFQMERFWSVRGADPAAYLPEGRNTSLSPDELAALAPLPTERDPHGAEDWNGPDQASVGAAWTVSGTARGVRWSVQRDYTEWFTDDARTITASTDWTRLNVGVRFDLHEEVLSTDPENNSLLRSLATPLSDDVRNHLELELLGRTADDPRAAALLAIQDPAARCFQVQELLPHTES